MTQKKIKAAIAAMEAAYDYILYNIAPGMRGKVNLLHELRRASQELSYSLPEDSIGKEEAA